MTTGDWRAIQSEPILHLSGSEYQQHYKASHTTGMHPPASSEDPLRGFLKFLNSAVHLAPLAAALLRRLPPRKAAAGNMFSVNCRPEVQHCCGQDDNGSIIAPLSEQSLQLLLAFFLQSDVGML